MLNLFKMGKKKCGLCGGRAEGNTGIMQYYAENDEGHQELFSMIICEGCADDLDRSREETKRIRDEYR